MTRKASHPTWIPVKLQSLNARKPIQIGNSVKTRYILAKFWTFNLTFQGRLDNLDVALLLEQIPETDYIEVALYSVFEYVEFTQPRSQKPAKLTEEEIKPGKLEDQKLKKPAPGKDEEALKLEGDFKSNSVMLFKNCALIKS